MPRPEHNFTELRQLLGCKRHEQPPPGYFFSFSDKVIARIEAGETRQYSTWWSWIVDRFDARPVLVCVYGLAVSGLLFMGIGLSRAFEAEFVASAPPISNPWMMATPGASTLFSGEVDPFNLPRSTVPVAFSSQKWSFRDVHTLELVPVSTFRLEPAGPLLEQ